MTTALRPLAALLSAALVCAGCTPPPEAASEVRDSAFPPCSGLLAVPMSMAGVGPGGVPLGLAPNPESPSDMCG